MAVGKEGLTQTLAPVGHVRQVVTTTVLGLVELTSVSGRRPPHRQELFVEVAARLPDASNQVQKYFE